MNQCQDKHEEKEEPLLFPHPCLFISVYLRWNITDDLIKDDVTTTELIKSRTTQFV